MPEESELSNLAHEERRFPPSADFAALANLGADAYNGLWDGSTDWAGPEVSAALEDYAKLMAYTNSDRQSLDWPDATVVSGDAVDVVARLKEESDVPLRSHGSLSLNRALMAAGLVDVLQVTIFPVLTGQTGTDPIFRGAADFDLELVESRTLDGHTQELTYRPTLHG